MNTKQLKYVLALAREGSFSRAADTLHISQPSLSQYIKKIEQEIGLPLFERTNGDVRLTDAGRIYLRAGRQILDLEHQMETQFADIAAYKTGSLIVGAGPYRTAGMMPAIARAFQEMRPGMHLVVREGTTTELTEGMQHGEYDLCLTLLPVDERLFRWEKVAEEELVLAVPATFPPLPVTPAEGRRYPAVHTESLEGQAFVMLTDTQFMQKQLEKLAADYRLTLRTAAVVKSLEAQIAMVRSGVGMALVPTGIERFCAPSEVTFYSFAQSLPKREVVVMWRKDRELSGVAEELKQIIQRIEW
ncbi:MAG: LysR family transcriptional regulator [Ruminococcaceae bacterium]|jgi:DNA-binding transcriptional LysR family regulator|nr:LysR family transcriptional regulator [Oscillospiraceae bacterium]